MLAHEPRIAAIRLHRRNRLLEPLDDPRMLRVFQADQDMQGVFAQGPRQELHGITHLG
ncbi:hypothetical protein D3C72_2268670 [compost metagenome]